MRYSPLPVEVVEPPPEVVVVEPPLGFVVEVDVEPPLGFVVEVDVEPPLGFVVDEPPSGFVVDEPPAGLAVVELPAGLAVLAVVVPGSVAGSLFEQPAASALRQSAPAKATVANRGVVVRAFIKIPLSREWPQRPSERAGSVASPASSLPIDDDCGWRQNADGRWQTPT